MARMGMEKSEKREMEEDTSSKHCLQNFIYMNAWFKAFIESQKMVATFSFYSFIIFFIYCIGELLKKHRTMSNHLGKTILW